MTHTDDEDFEALLRETGLQQQRRVAPGERVSGKVTFLGKPHLPVYDFVAARLEALTGKPSDRRQWLAIGDGLRTDILGAKHAGIDALLITGGIHERELADENMRPDPARMAEVMRPAGLEAVGAMRRLAW